MGKIDVFSPGERAEPYGGDIATHDLSAYGHFIIGLDGTLIREGHATEGAAEFLRAVADRFVLVSNNSRDTGRSLSAKLRRVGFDVPHDRIILAGEETIAFVARAYPRARCLISASRVLRHAARAQGLIPVSSGADLVIVGRDASWNYERLAELANEVRNGAVLIATNGDATHPGADGRIIPGTGALLAAIEAASGRRAEHVIGKPAPTLFLAALERLGADRSATVVIGDNPQTDGAGAALLGLRSLMMEPDRRGGFPNLADLCLALPGAAHG